MESVLFDPGYSKCVLGFSDSIEFMYSVFEEQIMPLKQKKFQFSVLLPKIKSMTEQNISFYLGCLLWASYIKSKKNAVIEDNPCLNETYDEESSLEESKYLLQFVEEKLPRDVKYFLNKPCEKNEKYTTILKTYNEFLKLNQGFTKTKTTDDIILPDNIKTPGKTELKEIKKVIDEALNQKDLVQLMKGYSLILD